MSDFDSVSHVCDISDIVWFSDPQSVRDRVSDTNRVTEGTIRVCKPEVKMKRISILTFFDVMTNFFTS